MVIVIRHSPSNNITHSSIRRHSKNNTHEMGRGGNHANEHICTAPTTSSTTAATVEDDAMEHAMKAGGRLKQCHPGGEGFESRNQQFGANIICAPPGETPWVDLSQRTADCLQTREPVRKRTNACPHRWGRHLQCGGPAGRRAPAGPVDGPAKGGKAAGLPPGSSPMVYARSTVPAASVRPRACIFAWRFSRSRGSG